QITQLPNYPITKLPNYQLTQLPNSLLFPQREIKRRSAVHAAFGPDLASVALDDLARRRQSNSCAFEFLRGMQTLEHAEELVGISHIKAGAVVGHKIYRRRAPTLHSKFNLRCRLLAGKFPRIPDQVLQHGP